MKFDLINKLFNEVKVPEAMDHIKEYSIQEYNSKSLLFDELLKIDPDFYKLFTEDKHVASEIFNNAFNYIHQQYSDMSENELAFCLCLHNCQEEDFKQRLKHKFTPEQMNKVRALDIKYNNDYNNDLINEVVNKVLQERTRQWFYIIRPKIARILNVDKEEIKFKLLHDEEPEFETECEDDESVEYRIITGFVIDGITTDKKISKEFIYDDKQNWGAVDIFTDKKDGKIYVSVVEECDIKKRKKKKRNQEENLNL